MFWKMDSLYLPVSIILGGGFAVEMDARTAHIQKMYHKNRPVIRVIHVLLVILFRLSLLFFRVIMVLLWIILNLLKIQFNRNLFLSR